MSFKLKEFNIAKNQFKREEDGKNSPTYFNFTRNINECSFRDYRG